MAVGQVATYLGTGNKTAGTAATATVTAQVGDTLIVSAGSDDRASSEAMQTGAVTDSAGNTWSRLQSQQSNDATAADHTAMAVWGTVVTNALTGGTVTLTPQSNVAAKNFIVDRFTGLSLTILAQTTSATATDVTAPAALTATPTDGALVYCTSVLEGPTGDTFTADSDTTNGNWSSDSVAGTSGGSAITNITVHRQYKIVNADGLQSYAPSNSNARAWTRGILVLAPTPPPAAAPPPPVYTPKAGIEFSTGFGRFTASLVDCYAKGPNFNPALPPIVYMAGVASDGGDLTGIYLPGLQPIVHALVDMGFAIVAPTTINSYGNAAGLTGITDALTYARNTLGCSTARAAFIGGSEGACDALTYAYTNPSLVACVVGLIPVIDLAEMVEQNVFGLASVVLAAHSVGNLPLPSTADPMTSAHQATLATIPIQLWYSTDDEVSANVTSFRAGTGCDIKAVGQLGHSNAAIAACWPTDIARFIRKRCAVPYLRNGGI